MSIRWRLTLYHALTMLLVTLLLVGALIVVSYIALNLAVARPVRQLADEVAGIIEATGSVSPADLERLTTDGTFLILRDEEGRVLTEAGTIPVDLDEQDQVIWRQALASGQDVTGEIDGNYFSIVMIERPDSPVRIVQAGKPYTILNTGGARIIVPPASLAWIIAAIALVSILPATLGSYLVARRALTPVSAMARSVRLMNEEDLSRRLPVKSRRDELGQLALTFNDLLARLELAFRDRERSLTQQRRFVADAGHELRTPLASILGYARMLRQWGLEDPETAREGLAAIEREAGRMNELVEDLLHLARVDEGPQLGLRQSDLDRIVVDAVEGARVTAHGKVTIRYEPPDGPLIALADPDRFRQAVDILLDNAVKYTLEGGEVTVSLHAERDGIVLEVADTGIGIPAEHLTHVFERFYRVDSARSSAGSGLGLSIAQQVTELHGGKITVISEPGRGSTFTLWLPRTLPESLASNQ